MRAWIMLLAAGIFVAGCGTQPGRTVSNAGPGSNWATVGSAPESAKYNLYMADKTDPLVSVDLNKGDDLGFHTDTNSNIYAVAGTKTFPLGYLTKQVYWKVMSAAK